MKETARMIIVLTATCILSAFVLSYVYDSTYERIAQNKSGALLEKASLLFNQQVTLEEKKTSLYENNVGVYQSFAVYDNEKNKLGDALVIDYPGYNGYLRIFVTLRQDTVLGIEMISQSETPGVGSRIAESDFKDRFKNKDLKTFDVDTISGATISSSSVIKAVKEYATRYEDEAGNN
ncbi:FMN-binding protein [Candidatus Woesearchaeota archaeon]|nr:FMN-binding protein [Candidatus Woesearchaeota archaeon]